MAMEWYYTKDKNQVGPVSQQDLLQKISSGEVSSNDHAWHEGVSDWQPISKFPELNSTSNPPAGPQSPAPSDSSSSSSSSVSPAPNQPVNSVRATSGLSIASLCLGCASAIMFCSCCFTAYAFLMGIPAIICGHLALREIKRLNGELSGRSMAITGLALGYCFGLLSVAMIIFFFVVSAVPSMSGDMDNFYSDGFAWEEPRDAFEKSESDTSSADDPPAEEALPEKDQ